MTGPVLRAGAWPAIAGATALILLVLAGTGGFTHAVTA